ncbi:DUF6161 domain-containing protein [Algisphaera agarilytica]|uniref:DUF6161 domain-containing protein n=1 Tax=Algisphaera agarilytica TaxID=1385975 RepID=A0A7X0H7E9_9BACT|nr:DUF6161 domain-containing protein [Algisphaera agarilytica]MBB6429190.1 hypothetical protein [Algisphaera agarilytica]
MPKDESEHTQDKYIIKVPGEGENREYVVDGIDELKEFLVAQKEFVRLITESNPQDGRDRGYVSHPLVNQVVRRMQWIQRFDRDEFEQMQDKGDGDALSTYVKRTLIELNSWLSETKMPTRDSLLGETLIDIHDRAGLPGTINALAYLLNESTTPMVAHGRPLAASEMTQWAADGVASIKLAQMGLSESLTLERMLHQKLDDFAKRSDEALGSIEQSKDTFNDFYATSVEQMKDFGRNVGTALNNFNSVFEDEKKARADEFQAASSNWQVVLEDMQKTQQTAINDLDAFMRLSPATRFWNRRDKEARKIAKKMWRVFFGWLGGGGFIVLSVVILLMIEHTIADWGLHMLSGRTHTEVPESSYTTAQLIQRLGVVGVFVTVYVFGLRVFSKLAMSAEHAAVDARERVSLIRTYQALVHKNTGFSEASFDAVVKRLTRPVPTGLVKADPISPISFSGFGGKP